MTRVDSGNAFHYTGVENQWFLKLEIWFFGFLVFMVF